MGNFTTYSSIYVDRDSVVGIAIRKGLEGRGSSPGGGEIFRIHPDRPWGLSNFLYNGYRAPSLKEEWIYNSTPHLDLHGLL